MFTAHILALIWLAFIFFAFGFIVGDRLAKKEKFTAGDIISAVLALVAALFTAFAVGNGLWKDRIEKFEKGEIVKVVNYDIKKIDGNVVKTDSTYTYKLIKKKD